MNKTKLKEYIDKLMQEDRISLAQEKLFQHLNLLLR